MPRITYSLRTSSGSPTRLYISSKASVARADWHAERHDCNQSASQKGQPSKETIEELDLKSPEKSSRTGSENHWRRVTETAERRHNLSKRLEDGQWEKAGKVYKGRFVKVSILSIMWRLPANWGQLQQMELIDRPFKSVAVDLLGPMTPASDNDKRCILTVIDHATRYLEAAALSRIDTITVAEALRENSAKKETCLCYDYIQTRLTGYYQNVMLPRTRISTRLLRLQVIPNNILIR